jgi:hypothetical protein
LLTDLEHNPAVTGITRGFGTEISIDKVTVGAVAGTPLRGGLLLATVSGHVPSADGQIGLGAATMRQVGAHVGSVVLVTVTPPSGGKRTVAFRVVSEISFPVLAGIAGLGSGAAFTISGYEDAACPPGPTQPACRQAVGGTTNGGLLVSVVPGARGRAAVDHYVNTYGSLTVLPVTPTSLVAFGEAVNFPLIFGVMLGVFGAATLAHLLVVSVARRRREIGLLKVLGFVNHQVASAVGWQATALALVGIVVGVPLGGWRPDRPSGEPSHPTWESCPWRWCRSGSLSDWWRASSWSPTSSPSHLHWQHRGPGRASSFESGDVNS